MPRTPQFMPSAVRIGGMSKVELVEELREHEVHLNRAAEALFEDRRFTTEERQQVIQIGALSVADLGLGGGGTYTEITACASASGLVECPLELGPHLRIQFLDQPEIDGIAVARGRAPRGSITVASVPLDDTDETVKGLYLMSCDGVSWLRGYHSSSDHVWSPEDVLVFRRTLRRD